MTERCARCDGSRVESLVWIPATNRWRDKPCRDCTPDDLPHSPVANAEAALPLNDREVAQ